MEVFYVNICGFISRDKFLYETRVLDTSYLRFKVKLPTSDSTGITRSYTRESCTPMYLPAEK